MRCSRGLLIAAIQGLPPWRSVDLTPRCSSILPRDWPAAIRMLQSDRAVEPTKSFADRARWRER
jgi:hypothetical protein